MMMRLVELHELASVHKYPGAVSGESVAERQTSCQPSPMDWAWESALSVDCISLKVYDRSRCGG